jgi:hypothetical protein
MGKSVGGVFRTFSILFLASLQIAPAYAGTIVFTESGVNARGLSANEKNPPSFLGTRNVRATVPKGTRGIVVGDPVKLPSGNFAIKVNISSLGDNETTLKAGDEIWVYYHQATKERRIQLFGENGKRISDVARGKFALTTETTNIPKSTPPKDDLECKTCRQETQAGNQPVSDQTVQSLGTALDKVKENLEFERMGDIPNGDIAIEEIIAYMESDQKANLSVKSIRRISEKTNRLIAQTLIDECNRKQVPIALALAVMEQESHFNPNAKSHAGARGLMQIMRTTYKDITKHTNYDALYDPKVNIRIGVAILADYIKQFGNLEDGLRAYNVGPGRLMGYLHDSCANKYRVAGSCTLPKETKDYVPGVLAFFQKFSTTTGTPLAVASN